MRRITLIAPTYLPSRRANTFQVMKMAAALAALGHEIRMLVPLPGGRHPEERPGWSDLAAHYGISVEFMIEWIPVSGRWRGYDFGLRAAARARAVEAGLVYTRHPQAALAAALRRLPTILEIHDYPQGWMGGLRP
jgi:hypothetical protein